ncbi:hypothetical protein KAM429_42270 [Aquipseudomonas alcaligenes]|uniref:Uncharacterized protein n=1 Tax=Aquipseudomonas alcaligenes TaxID=43263 RepID=A0AA37FNE3_AQUAC|nr:hypothetical protein KAM426_36970 [Pseudomonas alcaligenes]GIZ69077.1 hypothetical protein KAM428_41620 [Pseudomonas alcaligenes]GIZ73466.1 hypothetical protein KAM429_42270 [Pseudomonas alcaligenes]GIZ77821.1 hypothetical protein KAM430_42300 [Pseudomonas alcaligenes]GIZ82164.1 hypothetical protein KAM432_42120 [Pseudomonas alcaligenes]
MCAINRSYRAIERAQLKPECETLANRTYSFSRSCLIKGSQVEERKILVALAPQILGVPHK